MGLDCYWKVRTSPKSFASAPIAGVDAPLVGANVDFASFRGKVYATLVEDLAGR